MQSTPQTSNHDFSTLFELLPIGAYRSSPQGRQLRANAALVRMNGYANETEMLAAANDLATNWYVQPKRRDEFKAKILTDGHVVNFVSEVYRHKTRERIWIREHAHLVRNTDGAVLYFEGTVEDITRQHQAQNQLRENSALFLNLIHTIPDLVWVKDAQGTYQACNAAFERQLGLSAESIIGKKDQDFAGNQTAQVLASTDKIALQSDEPSSFEEDFVDAQGADTGTFEIIKAPMRNADGEVTGVLGMGRNITQRKHAEDRLRDTSEQFELAIISTELGMWSQSFNNAQSYQLDSRAGAMLGLAVDGEVDGGFWTDRIHPDDLPNALNEMAQHLENHTPFFEAEYRVRHSDGHWLWLSSRGKVVQTSATDEPLRMVGTLMDITARKKAEEAIRHLAFQDALTGLPNRRLLMDRLHQALTASARNKRTGALLFLDLDKFKVLNDTLGHDVGDQLLQQVAGRLLKVVRAVDTVSRIGGDEFVVLLSNLSENPAHAQALANTVGQKVLAILNEPYTLGDHQHVSTPSIGAALFNGLDYTSDEVLKQADLAMYAAKTKGRNNLCFFDESMNVSL